MPGGSTTSGPLWGCHCRHVWLSWVWQVRTMGSDGETMWAAVERCPPTIARADLRPCGRGESHQPIRAASLHLMVVLAGRGTARVGSQDYALATNQVLVVPWGDLLSFTADRKDPFSFASLHLVPWADTASDPPEVAHSWEHDGRLPAASAALPPLGHGRLEPTGAPLADLALDAVRAWQDRSGDPALRRLRLRGAALQAVAALAAPAATHDARIDELLSWLRQCFRLSITRAEMSRRTGLGAIALARAVREATGRSPTAYLIDLRLDEARRLVTTTTWPIAGIGKSVGIPDPAHFARLFRRRFGSNPASLRRLPVGPVQLRSQYE